MSGFEEEQNTQCATFYGAGCALYRDLLADLASLGAPPSPPPPPLPPLGLWPFMQLLGPVRIFFAQGLSPNMATPLMTLGQSNALASAPFRVRRHLQSQDPDVEGAELLDSSDDPAVIAACSNDEPSNHLSLCETNGYENAVRSKEAPFSRARVPVLTIVCAPPCTVDHVRPGRFENSARAQADPVQIWNRPTLPTTTTGATTATTTTVSASKVAVSATDPPVTSVTTHPSTTAVGTEPLLCKCGNRRLLPQSGEHGQQWSVRGRWRG